MIGKCPMSGCIFELCIRTWQTSHILTYIHGKHHTSQHIHGKHYTSQHIHGKHYTSQHIHGKHHTSQHIHGKHHTPQHIHGKHHTSQNIHGKHHTSQYIYMAVQAHTTKIQSDTRVHAVHTCHLLHLYMGICSCMLNGEVYRIQLKVHKTAQLLLRYTYVCIYIPICSTLYICYLRMNVRMCTYVIASVLLKNI